MARNGGGTVRVTLPASSVEDENDDQGTTIDGEVLSPAMADAERAERDADDDVIQKLTALDSGGDARWQVVRTRPADEAGYCFECTTEELTLDTIKRRAGPGTYRVTGVNSKGRYIGRRTVTIARDTNATPGTAIVPAAPNADAIMQFIERQKMAQKEELKFWAGLLLPILGPVFAQLFARRDSGIGELVGALKGLKGMTEPDDATAQLTKVKDLVALVRELSPEKEAVGSTWPDIVRDLAGGVTQALPAVASAFAARRAPQVAPTGDVLAGIPPENIAAAPEQPAAAGDPMLVLLGWLQARIPGLIVKAAKNSDPGAYAYVLLDDLPPGADLTQIYQFLQRPDWWTLFQGINPQVRVHEKWFAELREELLGGIEDAIPSLKAARKAARKAQTVTQDPEGQVPGQSP